MIVESRPVDPVGADHEDAEDEEDEDVVELVVSVEAVIDWQVFKIRNCLKVSTNKKLFKEEELSD